LALLVNFEALLPIKPGGGGAGRKGTGFRPGTPGAIWVGAAGRESCGSGFCGGWTVAPLLSTNLRSVIERLLSLFTDRRLQISGPRGGEAWNFDMGSSCAFLGVWGSCGLGALGGTGGADPTSESTPLSESFVPRLLLDKLRANPGESE